MQLSGTKDGSPPGGSAEHTWPSAADTYAGLLQQQKQTVIEFPADQGMVTPEDLRYHTKSAIKLPALDAVLMTLLLRELEYALNMSHPTNTLIERVLLEYPLCASFFVAPSGSGHLS